jgi:pyruvate/2-oxoglutarate/acetoin dehydrogenase E1 component
MQITYLQGLARAIGDAMSADSRVILMGSRLGGHFTIEENEAFAPIHRNYAERIFMSVPIAEFGLAGAALGVALAGGRPLLSFNIASFMLHGLPPIVNEAPNVHYTTGGQSAAPLTCYALGGIRGGGASQHSHRLQAMLGNIPGLQIFTPATAGDAYGLLKWCFLESQNPTVFFAHSELLLSSEEVDLAAPVLRVGSARICREGSDVTLITHSVTVPRALEAATKLAANHGISAEVIDLRTLAPLDRETLIGSIKKTGYAVVADECHKAFGVNAEIAAILVEEAFWHLQAPVCRVATADVPIPYNKNLEREISVTPDKIVQGVLSTMKSPKRSR